VLLVALLSAAAVVYTAPALRGRPIAISDEARQALLAEDTLRHGFRLPARVRDEPYLHKPPLFFWSVAVAALPAGHVSDLNASIPSVVAAVMTLLGVFALGRQLSGVDTGFVALAVLATSPNFFVRSHQVLPDMMLTAWLTWTLFFLLRSLASRPPRGRDLAGFYLCLVGALWAKGLPCLMAIPAAVAAIAVSVGLRELPSFRPVTGLGLVALTALPWAVLYARMPGREASEAVSAWHALTRYLNHFRHHPSLPFGNGLTEFLPWTLWLVLVAVWCWLTPDRRTYRPVLAWTAVFLFLLGLSVYQRSHYMLPVYPLFALLVAASVTTAASGARVLLWIHTTILAALLAAALIVEGGLLLDVPPIATAWGAAFASARPWEAASLVGIFIVGLATALWSLWARRSPSRAVSCLAVSLGFVLGLGSGLYAASLASTYSIQAFAERVRGSLAPGAAIVAYPDAGLAFDLYLDRPITEVTDRDQIVQRLQSPATGPTLLLVGDWTSLSRSAHPSWCSLGEVLMRSRSYVLLDSCR
jgi:4-amino-4-deoxy-L-arabinose transferase-like glycosyltransferase